MKMYKARLDWIRQHSHKKPARFDSSKMVVFHRYVIELLAAIDEAAQVARKIQVRADKAERDRTQWIAQYLFEQKRADEAEEAAALWKRSSKHNRMWKRIWKKRQSIERAARFETLREHRRLHHHSDTAEMEHQNTKKVYALASGLVNALDKVFSEFLDEEDDNAS
jgi:hypothetical protein